MDGAYSSCVEKEKQEHWTKGCSLFRKRCRSVCFEMRREYTQLPAIMEQFPAASVIRPPQFTFFSHRFHLLIARGLLPESKREFSAKISNSVNSDSQSYSSLKNL